MSRYDKDKNLDALFRAYVEGGERPSADITREAKRVLEGDGTVRAGARVPVPVKAGGSSDSCGGMSSRNLVIACAAGLFLLAAVILLLWYFISGAGGTGTLAIDGYGRVNSAQLTEKTAVYTEKEFLPFIEEDSVTAYKEYFLKENPEGTDEAVVYYVEYTANGGIAARLYVEVGDIVFDRLDDYKDLGGRYDGKNATYFIKREPAEERSMLYFSHGNYSYNLTLATAGEKKVDDAVSIIDNSFE